MCVALVGVSEDSDAECLPRARGHAAVFLVKRHLGFFWAHWGWVSHRRAFLTLPHTRQMQVFGGTWGLQMFAPRPWLAFSFSNRVLPRAQGFHLGKV